MPLFYVQELAAALIIFSLIFAFLIGVIVVLLVLDSAGEIALAWGEACTATAARAVSRFMQLSSKV